LVNILKAAEGVSAMVKLVLLEKISLNPLAGGSFVSSAVCSLKDVIIKQSVPMHFS